MFSQYTYNAGSTLSNILSDIILILTGETNKNNLSSDCYLSGTTIWSDVAAGWTIHDAAAGTNAQCIKALCEDGVTYKYVVIDMNDSSYLMSKVYEGWDAVVHSGTNISYYSNSLDNSQRYNLTNGGKMFIGASNRYCVFWSWTSGFGYGSSSTSGAVGCLERTRGSPWDTTANGYPPYVWWCTNGYIYTSAPRYKDSAGDITGGTVAFKETTEFGNIAGDVGGCPSTKTWDANFNLQHWLHEIGLTYQGGLSFKVGKFLDSIYYTTRSYGSAEDVIVYNGNSYFLTTTSLASQYMRILIPRF